MDDICYTVANSDRRVDIRVLSGMALINTIGPSTWHIRAGVSGAVPSRKQQASALSVAEQTRAVDMDPVLV